jgi:phage baseplate assembly protein W
MATVQPQLTGLALPAVRLKGGYFAARGTYDVAWGDLILAAFVPVGGQFMRRAAGGTAGDYLFGPVDGVLLAALQDAVVSAVARQCPHIRVISVESRTSTNSAKTVELSVSFTLATNPADVQTRLVQLDRRMVGNILRISRSSRS